MRSQSKEDVVKLNRKLMAQLKLRDEILAAQQTMLTKTQDLSKQKTEQLNRDQETLQTQR